MDQNSLLEKWLNDTLSDTEMEAFQELDDYPFYKDIVEDASRFKASSFSAVADFDALRKRLPKKSPPVRKLSSRPWLLRIASVFVIGFALYYFFLFRTDVRVETLVGQKTTIELPDASVVVLNALSEIEYSKKGWVNNRSLNLIGEAFFDVNKGATFDVITPSGTVTVIGTEFNVKQRGTGFEVACYEGIVRVTSGQYSKELRAGDRLRLSDGKLYVGKTTYHGPQWTSNISDFQQIPFLEVIEELERQYHIKVILKEVPKETLFTGGFVHDHLENAMQSIAEPMDLDFEITDNNEVTLIKREN